MTAATIDQAVKGAPTSNTEAEQAALEVSQSERLAALKTPRNPVSDPTSLLPSSPPQIYLNLLILEASLRSQYLTLRARRRLNTFALLILVLWIAGFSYLLFLRPREDGQGVGGSVYWVVDMAEKVAWMGGIVTGILFWGAGQWERGVRWPRRWVAVANRGLRGMNCKIVVIKGPWWKEALSYLSFILPYHLFYPSPGSSYHLIDHAQDKGAEGVARHMIRDHGHHYVEEDTAPGGDNIRLMLLPKPFSADFRENWEIYRLEYWEKENERRVELRKKVKQRQREIAKQEGGWLWWTGWRGWTRQRKMELERQLLPPVHTHSHAHTLSHQLRDKKRRPSVIKEQERDRSHSRSSSRSSVTAMDPDERTGRHDPRERRWSNSTAGSERRRIRAASSGLANSSRPQRLTPTSSRPTTPTDAPREGAPSLSKRSSTLSSASSSSDNDKVLLHDKFPGRAAAA